MEQRPASLSPVDALGPKSSIGDLYRTFLELGI